MGINKILKTKTNLSYFLAFIILLVMIFCLLYIGYFRNGQNGIIYEIKTKTNGGEDIKNVSEFKKSVYKTTNTLNILFVGDIMTDRYIRKQINNSATVGAGRDISQAENFVNKYLNNLKEINSNYDYVVANLEGPITDNKSKTLNEDGTYGLDLLFTFPTSTPEILKLLNVKVVSLANNHTDNFYHVGYVSTKKYLDKYDIKYFGNPYNDSGGEAAAKNTESLSSTVCKNDICITYIGYNKFTKNNDKDLIIEEIEKLRSGLSRIDNQGGTPDFIIVMAHWGDEYDKSVNVWEKAYARSWIDAGSDLVIGSHPHVIQESEIYENKYIYYSLGNYIFDQWFDKDVKKGLGVNFKFTKILNNENELDKKYTNKVELVEEKNVSIDRFGVRYMDSP